MSFEMLERLTVGLSKKTFKVNCHFFIRVVHQLPHVAKNYLERIVNMTCTNIFFCLPEVGTAKSTFETWDTQVMYLSLWGSFGMSVQVLISRCSTAFVEWNKITVGRIDRKRSGWILRTLLTELAFSFTRLLGRHNEVMETD